VSAPEQPTEGIDGSASMRGRVLGGLAWTGSSQVVMQVIRMIVAVVLARLLAPDDYGLAAIALVFSSLVLVFSDMSIGAAIIQRKVITEDDRSTAFWFAVGSGVVFTVAGVAISGPLGAFYGQPQVASLCAVLSLSFVITSLATTHEALLLRDMKFKSTEQRIMGATLAGAIAGLVVGFQTHDAWAIIAQELAMATTSTLLLWKLSPWHPRFRFSRDSLRHLFAFSAPLVAHRFLYYIHRNADNILIGRFVGAAALGAYSLAYNIMLVPFSRIAGPVQRVLAPAFARMQDEPQRIGDAWVRAVRLLGMCAIPALTGLIVVAPDFVQVVLGPKWSAAATLIQILAVVGMIQALQSISTDILQARGRTGTVLRFTVLFSVAHITGFVIGLHWGVKGVAAAYAITSILVEPVYLVLTARSISVSPWRPVLALRGVVEASVVMAVAVLATRMGLIDIGVPAFPRLVLCVIVGAAVFLPVSIWRCPEVWADLRETLGPAIGRKLASLRGRRRPYLRPGLEADGG
jgi:O-antigen/teichoic acid export membrane protein